MSVTQTALPAAAAVVTGRGALVIRFRLGTAGARPDFPHRHLRACPDPGHRRLRRYLVAAADGVRSIIEVGLKPGGDSDGLRSATGIPRLIWSLFWLAVALAALAFGGKMLVMPA